MGWFVEFCSVGSYMCVVFSAKARDGKVFGRNDENWFVTKASAMELYIGADCGGVFMVSMKKQRFQHLEGCLLHGVLSCFCE